MWYVVQVETGREQAACALIQQTACIAEADQSVDYADASPAMRQRHRLLAECFVPMRRIGVKQDGEWVQAASPLFPGYLVAVTSRVDDLSSLLRRVPAFARLVGHSNNAFIPLNPEEIAWIDAFTQCGHRVVEPSTAVIEGDKVTVVDGPMVGREGLIRRINHRKKLAYLELPMMGRTLQVEVGLKVIRKQCKKQKRTTE